MPSKYSRYADIKPSGNDWLGSIPRHWSSSKLKYMADVHPSNVDKKAKDGEQPVYLCNYTDVYYNDYISNHEQYMKATATEEQIDKFTLEEEDVIITKDSEDPRDIAVAAVVDENIDNVVCGYHLALIRAAHHSSGRYLKRFFDSTYANSTFATTCNGLTRYGLGTYAIKNALVPCPPQEEQRTIAAFLDHETAKIDTLVTKQERLIELLKEKRQAVISHAVTKGLDPDVPMKDSGVEWLGEVPAHWSVKTIAKSTQKITNGYVGPTRDILVDSGVEYVQATHIKQGRVNFDGAYFVTEEWSQKHAKSILMDGDVLVVQTGAGTGDIGLVTECEESFNCHALIILQPSTDQLIGEYLSLVLRSTYGQSKLYSIRTGGMHPHLNCGEVKFVDIPIPSKSEQSEICSFLRAANRKYSRLFGSVTQQITLLKERRTALISAAVTGKIDVTGWKADHE